MTTPFTPLDWGIFFGYFLLLLGSSFWLGRRRVATSRDFFLAGNRIPMLAAAVSILATTQSAATFLGGPEKSYKQDLTFIGFYFSALLAALFIARVLVPRFYAIRAVTVYALLEVRYGAAAKRQAGVMFLVGRLLASGARLYIGALAVAMILFGNIDPASVILSVILLSAGALGYAFFGGVRSVIYSDVLQAFIYVGAAVAVLIYLFSILNGDAATLFEVLHDEGKLTFVDFDPFGGTFNFWSLLGGWVLLNIAAYGLDQDMTQRVLSCKDAREAERALYASILLTIPVVLLFLGIGLLLYLYYHHPELSGFHAVTQDGRSVVIFMRFILDEMPEGLRALVTVGAIAAALSSTTSVLSAMASVAVEDLYRPWVSRRTEAVPPESYFVSVSRLSVLAFAGLLALMAIVSYYWQRHSDLPLVDFALGVMTFAYAGLIGVYFAALFTNRGSARTVPLGLGVGFAAVLFFHLPINPWTIGPAWQLLIAASLAFGVMLPGRQR